MYLKNLKYVILMVVIGLVSAAAHAAQEPPMGLTVNYFEVTPGMEATFEQISLKFKKAADQVGSPAYFGSSPAIGNDGMYIYASPFNSFAQLGEQQDILAQVYEGEELAQILQQIQDTVVSTRTEIMHPRPDPGIAPSEVDSPREITLQYSVTLKPFKQEQFVTYLQKLVEASKAVDPDAYWSMYAPGLGAEIWAARVPMNWVDLDTQGKSFLQRLTEHFGEKEGQKILEAGQAAMESVAVTVSRNRPDLSHAAPPAVAGIENQD